MSSFTLVFFLIVSVLVLVFLIFNLWSCASFLPKWREMPASSTKPGYAGRQTKRTQPESHASSVSTTFAYLAISLPLLFMLKCGSYSKRALKRNAVRPLLQLEGHICSPACAPSLVVIRGDTMCSGSGYQRTRRGDWSGSCFCSKSTSSD